MTDQHSPCCDGYVTYSYYLSQACQVIAQRLLRKKECFDVTLLADMYCGIYNLM